MSIVIFFFKQRTAYELRIGDWSSDVCSSDLHRLHEGLRVRQRVPTAFARGRGEVVVEIDVRRSRHVAALELLKARGPAHPVAHVEDGRAGALVAQFCCRDQWTGHGPSLPARWCPRARGIIAPRG